jgi:hypothetical protein
VQGDDLKPYDPKNYGKPQIRLPSDAEHGPNPYDSKSKLTGPRWLTDWTWWAQIIILALMLVAVRYFTNGGSFT